LSAGGCAVKKLMARKPPIRQERVSNFSIAAYLNGN
jgi:hypothetical protein